VTCSCRLENPAELRLPPSLFFLGFWNFSDVNEGRGTSQPLYKGGRAGRPAAGRPGGAGRPTAGRPAPGTCVQLFDQNFLHKNPYRPAAGRPGPGRPAAGRPGYIPVNFQIENIFFKKQK